MSDAHGAMALGQAGQAARRAPDGVGAAASMQAVGADAAGPLARWARKSAPTPRCRSIVPSADGSSRRMMRSRNSKATSVRT